MLSDTLDNISTIMGISNTIIPNIITLIIVTFILILTFKGQLSWVTLGFIYAISMGILTILGIDSVFNIVTLIKDFVTNA